MRNGTKVFLAPFYWANGPNPAQFFSYFFSFSSPLSPLWLTPWSHSLVSLGSRVASTKSGADHERVCVRGHAELATPRTRRRGVRTAAGSTPRLARARPQVLACVRGLGPSQRRGLRPADTRASRRGRGMTMAAGGGEIGRRRWYSVPRRAKALPWAPSHAPTHGTCVAWPWRQRQAAAAATSSGGCRWAASARRAATALPWRAKALPWQARPGWRIRTQALGSLELRRGRARHGGARWGLRRRRAAGCGGAAAIRSLQVHGKGRGWPRLPMVGSTAAKGTPAQEEGGRRRSPAGSGSSGLGAGASRSRE
jgi:hypothetical protein